MEIRILNDNNAELFNESKKIATLKLKEANNRRYVDNIFIKEDFKEIYTKIDIVNIIFGLTNSLDVLFKEDVKNV